MKIEAETTQCSDYASHGTAHSHLLTGSPQRTMDAFLREPEGTNRASVRSSTLHRFPIAGPFWATNWVQRAESNSSSGHTSAGFVSCLTGVVKARDEHRRDHDAIN